HHRCHPPPTFPPSSAAFSPHGRSRRCCCLPLPDATIVVVASDRLICCSARCHLPPLLPAAALDHPHLPHATNAAMLPAAAGISIAPSAASVPFPYCCHLLHRRWGHRCCPRYRFADATAALHLCNNISNLSSPSIPRSQRSRSNPGRW
ncbi:hypothetical protein BHE74_00046518, partial [Ensete ventricosum]